jgi:hypothetical protein
VVIETAIRTIVEVSTTTSRVSMSEATAATKLTKSQAEKISFFRLKPILEIIQSAIWTGRIADEKPISICLVAEPESAKTECLKFFRGTKTITFISDLTSRGLNVYRNDIESGKLRHLVIMDLVRIVNHGKGVSTRTIQTLSTIIEEGEADSADGGGRQSWTNFPQVGCLTAITPAFFRGSRAKWRESGFLSRLLPVRFSYSDETVRQIHDAIALGHKLPEPEPVKIFDHSVIVSLNQADAITISNKAALLGKSNGTYGFRYNRALRTLAKGRALACGRGKVEDSDVAKVLEWSDFFSGDNIVEL